MTKRGTLLLIDYNSLFRRVLELSAVNLEYEDMPTTAIYGFIAQFCSSVNATNPNSVIVVSDKKPYIRNSLFKDYKKKHVKSEVPQEVIQFNYDKVNKFLELLNISVWMEKGLEADDLIAICCNKLYDSFEQIIIASSDSDLYQLLKYSNVFLRKKVGKKYVLYSKEHFRKEYGMTTKQFIRYLSLKGTHNSVPGIKGIGIKGARKISLNEELWSDTYDKHKEELDLYRKLIRLPFDVPIVKFPKLTETRYSDREMIKLLSSVGIDVNRQMDIALKKLEGNNNGIFSKGGKQL